MRGKRTRKPKDLDDNTDKPEYGNGTRCNVEEREYNYLINNAAVISKYQCNIYETNTCWGITSKDWNIPINSLEEAKEFVEINFGGKWLWKEFSGNNSGVDNLNSGNDTFNKLNGIYVDIRGKITQPHIEDSKYIISLLTNAKVSLNWMRNELDRDIIDEVKLKEYEILAKRTVMELENYVNKVIKEKENRLNGRKRK